MSKTCNNCGTEAMAVMPIAQHEKDQQRLMSIIKKQWIALIVAICMIVGCNALWLYAWMQYDYTSEEIIVEQDTTDGGNANYIGNDGDIINGISKGDETQKNTP